MPRKQDVMINTVPLPERPLRVEIKIPVALAQEFKEDLRIVIRHPWIIGIPVPERLLDRELVKKLGKELEIIIAPR